MALRANSYVRPAGAASGATGPLPKGLALLLIVALSAGLWLAIIKLAAAVF